MNKKSTIVGQLTKGIEMLFKKNKVEYIKGYGKFQDKHTLNVLDSNGATVKTITSSKFIIATGSEPNNLPGGVLPIDENRVISSTGALSLKEVPKKLIVVGGGVIGLELGSVFRRLGAQVEVVEFADSILPSFDLDVRDAFLKILKKDGINFRLKTKVVGGLKKTNEVEVVVEDEKGAKHTITGDYVLVATGRRPYTTNLGLENIGITTDKRGVIGTDPYLETPVKGIYAIGDCVEGPMLAHKGEEEGVAVVERIVDGHGHVNYDCIPNVVYTHPEVASVGASEDQLKAKNIKYKKGVFPFLANSRAKANDDNNGFVKILADAASDKILGVHILGASAGELIAECVLALEYGASSEDIARTCHAHPTLSEAVKEAALATFDKPLNF